jgi:hypothetical protein
MNMSYATIHVFGQEKRLYREVFLKYMASSKNQPNNHPIYSIDTEVGSSIFFNNLSFKEGKQQMTWLSKMKLSIEQRKLQINKTMQRMKCGI